MCDYGDKIIVGDGSNLNTKVTKYDLNSGSVTQVLSGNGNRRKITIAFRVAPSSGLILSVCPDGTKSNDSIIVATGSQPNVTLDFKDYGSIVQGDIYLVSVGGNSVAVVSETTIVR